MHVALLRLTGIRRRDLPPSKSVRSTRRAAVSLTLDWFVPSLDARTLLQTEATDVASHEGLEELVELLLDRTRTFPVVVFSPPPRSTRTSTDPTGGGRVWTRRKDVAAQTPAGLAKVFVLGQEVIAKFNAASEVAPRGTIGEPWSE